jgi:hypothetical protein
MRRLRKIGVLATLAALATAAVTTGTATAASSGNGSTQAATTLVNIGLGPDAGLLNVTVAGDTGLANTDPKVGTSSASSSLSPLTVGSSVSALNISVPKVSVSSTGAPQTKSVPSISLATPVSSGAVAPLSLAAVVDPAKGAAAGLTSTVSNLSVVGGLLSVPTINSNMGSAATPADSDGLRGIEVPSIQVLNLGAVLQGLGINPANLTVGQVSNALDAVAKTVSTGAGNLNGTQLTQLSGLQQLLTTPPLNALPPATPLSDPLVAPVLAAITAAIPGGIPVSVTTLGGLTTLLTGAFTSAVNTLGATPLLSVTNLVAGLSTKAADTVANSVASIEAGVGQVQIGNLPAIPGVNATSTAAQVTGLVNTAQGQVNSVLATVGLGNLVTVKVLDQAKSVASDKGYVNALARLTGLHVAIAPLSSLASARTPQAVTDTVGTILGAGNVPALSAAMTALNGALGGVNSLAQGASVDVLSVGSSSAFAVPASATPVNPAAPTPSSGTLAVTGGSTQLLGLVGLFMLAGVAGLRRLRRPARTN